MNNILLNSYNQNAVSLSYFNIELLTFHCEQNIENIHFTPIYFKVPPVPSRTEIINDNLRDKIRRVNNSVIYLGNAVNGLTNLYMQFNHESDQERRQLHQNYYRQMCRNACVELFVYFEKVKSLIRYYLTLIVFKFSGK